VKVRRCELGGWRARTTFVLAMAAAAVGLGNLWRFSYLLGSEGGAAFMLTYLGFLLLVAVPAMITEVVIGSHGRGSPLVALRWTSDRSLLSRGWIGLGLLACLAGVLVLSYLAVIAGWLLAYAWYMYSGVFSAASAVQVGAEMEAFLHDAARPVFWQTSFLLVTGVVVALGVRRGIGILVWLVVPVLLFLLVFVARFSFEYGDVAAAGEFLFSVKLVDFTHESVMLALGHAFFTLGVGVGAGISYGAYAPRRIPIGRSVLAVGVFDTLVALLAGLAIYPLIFANNIEPAGGPALLFVSLPYAFGNMPLGDVIGALFFVAVAIAALGSAVALLEPAVGAVIQGLGIRRPYAAVVVVGVAWFLGMVLIRDLAAGQGLTGNGSGNLLELLDHVTAAVLLPLVSLLTALYAGWRLRPEILQALFGREAYTSFVAWRLLVRYVVPVATGVILVVGLATRGV
jgi:NSS family neurotransmitter:Na+ symporter